MAYKKRTKRAKKLPEKSQRDRMEEVLNCLREKLKEEELDIIDISNGNKGMIFHQVDILGGMETLNLDNAGITGVLVERFRKRFGVEPEWFTKFNSGNSIVVVLGPVPASTLF